MRQVHHHSPKVLDRTLRRAEHYGLLEHNSEYKVHIVGITMSEPLIWTFALATPVSQLQARTTTLSQVVYSADLHRTSHRMQQLGTIPPALELEFTERALYPIMEEISRRMNPQYQRKVEESRRTIERNVAGLVL